MHKISAITFIIVFQLFYAAMCSEFFKRQTTTGNSSASSNSSGPVSETSTAAITAALEENGIPSSCFDTCISPYNATLTCTLLSCECNDQYEKGLFDCYLCAGEALHASFDTVQSKIDQLNEECMNAGFNLTVLTFPGENSTRNAALPTSSASVTLVLPTTTGPTPNQGLSSLSQVTQGTQPTSAPGAPQNATSPEPASQSPSSDGVKVIPIVELAYSIGLMSMGSLLISF